MLRDKTAFAGKIIEFFSERGVECLVVDERLSLRVTLSLDGKTRELRYGSRAFSRFHNRRAFYSELEEELSKLKASLPAPVPFYRERSNRVASRQTEEAGEEVLSAS